MSFLDKILRRKPKPGAALTPKGVLSPDVITDIAQSIADQKPGWAKWHRELRQYRLDAHIRRELKKTRAYAVSSRPRTPQSKAKVVGRTKDYLELSNGQRIRCQGPLLNPVLHGLRA